MKFKHLLLLFTIFFCGKMYADGSFSLVIDNSFEEESALPTVKSSHDNISLSSNFLTNISEKYVLKTAPNSYASEIAVFHKYWQPKWNLFATGKIMVPKVSISDDKSILYFCENYGDRQGPFGSRIVLVNSFDWSAVQIAEFPDLYITDFSVLPDNKLLLFSKEQKSIKQKAKVIYYDIKSNKLMAESDKIDFGIGKNILADRFFINLEKSGDSFVLNVYALSTLKPLLHFPVEANETSKVHSFMGKIFVVTGKNVYQYSITNKLLERKYQFSAPITNFITFDKYKYVLLSSGVLYQIYNGRQVKISSKIYKPLFPIVKKDEMFFYDSYGSALSLLKDIKLGGVDLVDLKRGRPRLSGKISFIDYLPQHDKYILFTDTGDFFMFYKVSRRWRKIKIWSAYR